METASGSLSGRAAESRSRYHHLSPSVAGVVPIVEAVEFAAF